METVNFQTILKSIQSYINETFGVQSTTSTPIIISLSIFILGFLINGLIKTNVNYNKRKATRKILFLSLESLSKNIEKQGRIFSKFSDTIGFKSAKEKINTVGRIEIFQLTTLKQMGYENIFNSLFTGSENIILKPLFPKRFNKRIKAFNKIWEAIEFVKTWQESALNDLDTFMEKLNKANFIREKAIQELLKILEPELHGVSRNSVTQHSTTGQFLFKVDSIVYNAQQLPNRTNPFILHRNLIIPLRLLCREYKNKLDIVFKIIPYLMEATYAYVDMSTINKMYKLTYRENGLYFKRHAKLILIAKSILN